MPSIAVVPPTPDGLFTQFCGSPQWDEADIGASMTARMKTTSIKTITTTSAVADSILETVAVADAASPEDSPQDEEPPYRSLNTSLKRYGTMSSLERFSSEDVDEKTYNSSEEDANDTDGET